MPNLVTVDETKTWLQLENTSGSDGFLTAAVAAVSDAILREVGMVNAASVPIAFDDATVHTVTLDGPGTDRIGLPHRNVKQIDALYEDIDQAFGAGTLIAATEYVLDGPAGIVIRKAFVPFLEWPQSLRVLYVLNWAATPDMVKMLTRRQIGYEWNVRKNQGVQTRTLPDGSVVYVEPVALLPAVIKGLKPFKQSRGIFG
jgi:hypothetical protein